MVADLRDDDGVGSARDAIRGTGLAVWNLCTCRSVMVHLDGMEIIVVKQKFAVVTPLQPSAISLAHGDRTCTELKLRRPFRRYSAQVNSGRLLLLHGCERFAIGG